MVAKRFGRLENVVLLIGLLALVYILTLGTPTSELEYPYPYTFWIASAALKGLVNYPAYPEIGQDIVGFRHIARSVNAYQAMGDGFAELGIGGWDTQNGTTHPPTAFLLVAPFAFLPVNFAIAGWAWLMVALLTSALVCYGFSRKMALGLTLAFLLWPPMAHSLTQLTIVWMWGIAIGYRFARDRTFWGGVGIGIASLTKFFPALMLANYILKRQWAGLTGCIALWLLAGFALAGLDVSVFSQYFEVNRTNSFEQLIRPENAAFLGLAYRWGGWLAGLAVILSILALGLVLYWRFRERVLERTYLWMGLSYLAVVLLPLVWIYSVAPLLPVIIYLGSRKKLSTVLLAVLGFLIPFVSVPWGTGSVVPLALTMGVVGLGLIFDVLPYRAFTARTVKELYAKRSTEHFTPSPSGGSS